MLKLPDSRAPFPDSFSPARLSGSIGISRVLCILGVVYVHAWTGLDGGQLVQANGSAQGVMRWVLMELLGRSAVPLLGMISGWLVAGSAWSRSYGSFMRGKARTILLPMLIWNALAMLIITGGAALGLLAAPLPGSAWIAVDQLFAFLSPNETNVQMAFLRDLFVCMAFAPLLVRMRSPWLWSIAGATALWSVSGWMFPLLLRPSILIFFIAGIMVRRSRFEARVAAIPVAWPALIFGICALVKIWLSALATPLGDAHPHMMAAFDLLLRFSAALFFWRLAWHLAGTSKGAILLRIEPYAFLIFCSHLILIWLAGPGIGLLTGPLGSPAYPAYLLLQPVLAAAAGILIGRGLMVVAPRAAELMSGGRLKVRQNEATPSVPRFKAGAPWWRSYQRARR
ncbi:acyltransferase family protein [Rhizorhapis suberifaciens]|uniref:Acyltransferase 3 domain-containing protein n=1 Tax=Rhizorhapis suberifaciens TaxID=13656 RepID=A0A840HTD2_9SPHN|nr:acyltransferase [Rhizorhapis suberifaciens]MBB4640860.1 hypothetical protein [Rhizorhapis suberifaciens]